MTDSELFDKLLSHVDFAPIAGRLAEGLVSAKAIAGAIDSFGRMPDNGEHVFTATVHPRTGLTVSVAPKDGVESIIGNVVITNTSLHDSTSINVGTPQNEVTS